MPDLNIPLSALSTLGDDLNLVRVNFSAADLLAGEVADMVGHDHLAAAVRAFASKWNDRRDDIVTALAAMIGTVDTVVEEFTALDRALADALEGENA
ncbi:hypothetical protein HQQ80_11695 [Microbacteriaceae bacterium VKM Ac-2855]|nr:hypothetical protein [Microbacteriaceae bacterium VKM Ac-2855]